MVNRVSIWANIGKYYGEGPGYGIIAVAIAILIGKSNDDIKKQRYASYIIILIGVVSLIIAIIVAINELFWLGKTDLAWVILGLSVAMGLQAVYLLIKK